jgi:hypothetical protein
LAAAGTQLTGQVTNQAADPISGVMVVMVVMVELLDDGGSILASGTTNPSGALRGGGNTWHLDVRSTPPSVSGFAPETVPDFEIGPTSELDVVQARLPVPGGLVTVSGVSRDGAGRSLINHQAALSPVYAG